MSIKRACLNSVLGVTVLFATACQDPYPEGTEVSAEAPPRPGEVLPPYGIQLADIMNFNEGEEASYTFKVWVPDGEPVVEFEDLPQGVVYDEEEEVLVWEPSYSAANEPSDPFQLRKEYPVKVTLRSSVDPITSVSKRVILVVKDTLQSFSIVPSTTNASVFEGSDYSMGLTVTSLDFPNGPFLITIYGVPSGVQVTPDAGNPNEFTVSYSPDYSVVDINAASSCGGALCNVLTPRIAVTLPNGITRSQSLTWNIIDTRQLPMVVAPANIEDSSDIVFNLSAVDLNKEDLPDVSLVGTVPFGQFSMAEVSSDSKNPATSPTRSYNVRWTQIPLSAVGSTETLHFQNCVWMNSSNKNFCRPVSVEVTFLAQSNPSPVIDRSNWLAGNVRYVRLHQMEQAQIPISDPSNPSQSPSVSCVASDAQDVCSWQNGILTVQSGSPGLKMMSITAMSNTTGSVSTESFMYEILPSAWSDTILFAQSLTSNEVVSSTALFNSSNVINPAFQPLNARRMAHRAHAFVTTGLMSDQTLVDQTEPYLAAVSNIMVSSPLLSRFQGDIDQEIQGLGISYVGRLADISGAPALSSLTAAPGPLTGIPNPSTPAVLNGTLTSESSSPMVLQISSLSACIPSIVLVSALGDEFVVAATCTRANGGKLVVSGFEWGDLSFDSSEAILKREWLWHLLNM